MDGEEGLHSPGKFDMVQGDADGHGQAEMQDTEGEGHQEPCSAAEGGGGGVAACQLSSAMKSMQLGDGPRGTGEDGVDNTESARDVEEEAAADAMLEEMVKLKKMLGSSKALVGQLGEEIRVMKAEMNAINAHLADRYGVVRRSFYATWESRNHARFYSKGNVDRSSKELISIIH